MDDRTRRSRTPARDHHHAREIITLGSRVLRRGVAQFGDDVTQLRCFVYVIAYLKFLRIKTVTLEGQGTEVQLRGHQPSPVGSRKREGWGINYHSARSLKTRINSSVCPAVFWRGGYCYSRPGC